MLALFIAGGRKGRGRGNRTFLALLGVAGLEGLPSCRFLSDCLPSVAPEAALAASFSRSRSEKDQGRAHLRRALVRVGCQAALSGASLWAVEEWTSKVRITGAVSSKCCTVFCTASNCSRS